MLRIFLAFLWVSIKEAINWNKPTDDCEYEDELYG